MRPTPPAAVSVGITMLMMSVAAGGVESGVTPDDEVAAGRALYEGKCSGCHSVDTDRIGPRHRNVVGRTVASVIGYDYSPALKLLGGRWTAERLDRFLSGTQQMAPASKMYVEVDDSVQRRLLIGYLQSVSRPARQRQ
jgi:cytochrome c